MADVSQHDDVSAEDIACITLAEAAGYEIVPIEFGAQGTSWYWVHSGDLRVADISRPTKALAARAALNLSGEGYDV